MKTTVFIRALEADDKAAALLEAACQPQGERRPQRFEVATQAFASVPGSPFAYWISDSLRSTFSRLPTFEGGGRIARKGLTTSDDDRYVRLWWEPRSHRLGKLWPTYAKGGNAEVFWASLHSVVRWDWTKRTIPGYVGRAGRESLKVECADLMGSPGLTWPLRAAAFSPSVLPARSVFSARGYTIQAERTELPWLLAITSSAAFDAFFKISLGRSGHPEFIVGVLQQLPLPEPSEAERKELSVLAHRAWSATRNLDTRIETSHALMLPALLQVEGETLAVRTAKWRQHIRYLNAELARIQAEIDEHCFGLYGIDQDDRRAIIDGFVQNAGESDEPHERVEDEAAGDAEDDDEAEAESVGDTTTLAAELVSWAVGVAFGRFDVRLATGDRPLPSEPEPFDPLPVCSPGMLTGDDGLPLALPPAGYPLPFPDDGILVDDPGHPRDITAAVRAVFEAVFGSRGDAMWQEAAALLEPRDHDLRRWLATEFFEHHLRRHSKSRRKAPILWQLSIPSGRYSVWCYAHKMTRDSLLAIQNDVVALKLAHEERRLSSLVSQTGQTPSAQERAEIATQASVVDELRTLVAEVRRVTPLWNPDLDDGIVLVMAPLWRLVPTHKAWQKELKARWDELAAGKYDWAQLAMHLWPERVVPKCATDRSLAIAHELEDVFWAEGRDGKWTARTRPTRPTAELIAERNSPAAKAALVSLLEASILVAGAGRRK